jgi:nitroimidazol reductase NimA-like FMN-containing flavoprotein (pyridoxamine 5'-phosphate oxidase superfamily)
MGATSCLGWLGEGVGLPGEAVVGRLAVVAGDQPEIFPVNYLDHGSIVFRTGEGTKLAIAIGRLVAFEVDGYDAASGEAR